MKRLVLAAVFTIILSGAVYASDTADAKPVNISFAQLLAQVKGELPRPPDTGEPLSVAAAEDLKKDSRYWVTIQAGDKYVRTALLEAGLDIAEIGDKSVSGFITAADLDKLPENGFTVQSRQTIYEYAKKHLKDFPAADARYHNYQETIEVLQGLAAANPELASLFSIGRTTEGREIWCLRLNSTQKGPAPGSKPGALYMGTHHAREHLSNEVALLYAVWLLEHKNDPEIRKYLDTLDIYIIPMVNPDGAEYDIRTGKYRWHRKNMRPNPDKSIGVDLNRNYDFLWCTQGASHSPGSETYCGPSAFSEPEPQAIKAFVPARPNLKVAMSYHSYSSLILYPWAGKDAEVDNARDRGVFTAMGAAMGKLTGYRPQRASDLYVATGETGDWLYSNYGIFGFTTELEGRSFYPGADIIDRAVAGNIKAALYMLSVADDPYKVLR
ncbi:MAG: carboxypeptidase [Elusimicrobia bacterium CG08_land_8_20_14_0_20_59_10]|nr:MAG: carboxypeptidase [Elusimicrobia bacterium CG08_land_8_20_14_0_20_59_10]